MFICLRLRRLKLSQPRTLPGPSHRLGDLTFESVVGTVCALNSIFRIVESMGLPRDMRVYGWGLSLERPTMIKYAISNIRELLGHKVDLNFIATNPAVRLDKD